MTEGSVVEAGDNFSNTCRVASEFRWGGEVRGFVRLSTPFGPKHSYCLDCALVFYCKIHERNFVRMQCNREIITVYQE